LEEFNFVGFDLVPLGTQSGGNLDCPPGLSVYSVHRIVLCQQAKPVLLQILNFFWRETGCFGDQGYIKPFQFQVPGNFDSPFVPSLFFGSSHVETLICKEPPPAPLAPLAPLATSISSRGPKNEPAPSVRQVRVPYTSLVRRATGQNPPGDIYDLWLPRRTPTLKDALPEEPPPSGTLAFVRQNLSVTCPHWLPYRTVPQSSR